MSKYYVNEEKGTVVSVYDSGDWGLSDFAKKVLKHVHGPRIYRNIIADIINSNIFPIYPQYIRGVAKLGENDSWDETTGKKIADQKVALKKNDRIVKQAITVKKHLLNIVKELDVIISKYSEKCAAIEEDFDRFYVKGGMMMEVILYSTHCPKCDILEKKLDLGNIKYTTVTDADVMIERGFKSAPILEVDGVVKTFKEAIDWLEELED